MCAVPAEYYDLLYVEKNYEREAQRIRQIISARRPGAQMILDLACGTGRHDEYLNRYFEVDGIDINADYLNRARERNGGGSYTQADMGDFRLDRLYDGAVCLFSAIGYKQTLSGVRQVLACVREHLVDGGVFVVEPWFTPDNWKAGSIHTRQIERDGVLLQRVCYSEDKGSNTCHHLIATKGEGIRHFAEEHLMGLFTVSEMCQAFSDADFDVDYDERGLTGRGL